MKSINSLVALFLLAACSNPVKHATAEEERTVNVVETETNMTVTTTLANLQRGIFYSFSGSWRITHSILYKV